MGTVLEGDSGMGTQGQQDKGTALRSFVEFKQQIKK